MNRITTNTIVVMFILMGTGSGLVFTSVYSQSMGNSSTTGNQTASGNISKGSVGSASQLSKVLGNNTELIANKTPIGKDHNKVEAINRIRQDHNKVEAINQIRRAIRPIQ